MDAADSTASRHPADSHQADGQIADGRAADGRVGTLVHAADLHLGAPLRSLGARVGAERAEELRREAARAFDELIELTLRVEADVLVLAGDVYDQAEYEVAAQVRLTRGLGRLVDAGVAVFVAHGNHDPLVTTFRPAATMPSGVTVFTPGDPQVHHVELRSGHPLDVVGVSFGRQHESTNLARGFAALAVDPRRAVGVLHTNVGSNPDHGDYAPCTVADLEAAPIGYWALGHVHLRQVHPLGPGRWWAYPGNLQGRSTKASECGPKGALVVPVLADGFAEPQFHPCDRVRFTRLDADVSAADDLGGALDIAADDLRAAAADTEGRPLVARVRLGGRTAAHTQLRTEPDLASLLRDHVGAAAIATVEVATRPLLDRQQVLERDNLQADLLRSLDAVDDARTALVDLVGDELPAAARRRLLDLLDEDRELAGQLLVEVERLLVDGLEEPA